MDLALHLALVTVGLAILAVGGEALVRGASRIALLAGLTPAVVGLTVVALGTSFPELVVSLMAALRDQPDLAVGNVVGSNIFNVGAALGAAALVAPLLVHGAAVRLEWPMMFVVTWVALLLMRDGQIDRLEGAFFVVALAVFVAYSVWLARHEVAQREAAEFSAEAEARSAHPRRREALVSGLLVVAGVVLLVLGGKWLVDGSVALARLAGWSERIIGLTIVAAGTSAPELAASVMAALRGRTDVALANIIGSCIFNLLGILGLSALVRPLPVAAAILHTDVWWMVGFALLLFPIMFSGRRISRLEGGLLLGGYTAYLGLLLR